MRTPSQGLNAELVEVLCKQRVVKGDRALAAAIAETAAIRILPAGVELITQEEDDNMVYFLLSGAVNVEVNGRAVARRTAGETVGEMAAIDPRALRAATVRTAEATAVCCLEEPQITSLGQRFPSLWRNLAREMSERLRQQNRQVRSPNPRPVLALHADQAALGAAVADALRQETVVLVAAEAQALDTAVRRLENADFAVLALSTNAALDGYAFWLGLALGTLGRGRALVLSAGDQAPWPGCQHFPLDARLLARDPAEAVGDVAEQLRSSIAELGPR